MRMLIRIVLLLLIGVSSFAYANSPTVDQVYQVARSGHLEQAHQMMGQVIADHPNSAKAYFIDAEILASMGNKTAASQQLAHAESLDSGLAFATPESVNHLKQQLAVVPSYANQQPSLNSSFSSVSPFVFLLVGIIVVGILYRMFRARIPNPVATQPYGSQYQPTQPTSQPMSSPSAPMAGVGSGIGSGILGSLATGAAIGAGKNCPMKIGFGSR